MKKISKVSLAVVLAVAISLCLAGSASAASPARVYLRTADHFAILAGAGITDAGGSEIHAGDIGNPDGAQITGILPAALTGPGIIYDSNGAYVPDGGATTNGPLMTQAIADWKTARDDAAGRPANQDLSATPDLGGMTLYPGVYIFTSTADLTGTLTLDANGEADPVWIFQIGSGLTTASTSSVSFTNTGTGGRLGTSCDVFWQVGTQATLGSDSSFVGIIMAGSKIEMLARATLLGSAFAEVDQATLINNDITKGPCALAPPAAPIDTAPIDTAPADTAPIDTAPGSVLPDTGVGPDANTIRWSIALLAAAILAGIFGVSFVLRVYRRKKVTS